MAAKSTAYDVAVIGGGPGGYTAAIRASQLGLKAAVVEAEPSLGGVCLNWGCIPTKALLKQAELYHLMQRADEFGLSASNIGFDWTKLIARSREISAGLAKGVGFLMKKNKVDVYAGRGKIAPGKKLVVQSANTEAPLEAKNILLATGGRPRSIPGVEIDGSSVVSSREAMVLKKQPKAIAIIGAGAIGAEFAYFFNAFGTEVHLFEAETQVLPREDEEVAHLLAKSLGEQGINVRTGVAVTSVAKSKSGVKVAFKAGGEAETTSSGEVSTREVSAREVSVDVVLMAVGVAGNTEGLGLEANGVRTRRGQIEVDGRMETNVKGIYAVGDVVGPPQLAHAAAAEGVAAAEFIAGKSRPEIDPEGIPSCTYCQPQVASVGLTEKSALEQGHEVKVGRFPFAASGKARASGETDGLVKLVFAEKYGELLGASIIGSEATELIAEVALGKQMEATWEELATTIHSHPTLSEAVMEAAGEAFGEALNI